MAKKKKTTFSKETYLDWYETMLRIRRFEERALMAYSQRKIRGFCHVYIGQEAVAAGMRSASRPTDNWITAYRQHGLAIAKGIDTYSAMAELYGKETGNVQGRGGSMHFFSKEKRFFGGDGIVGGQIPTGAGIALAEQYKGTDNVTLCLFGDGAARQGSLFETFNMAMTWKLPVVFIVENNGYAMGTSVERTSNVTDLYKIGHAFEMPSFQVDGMDPEAVHEAMESAMTNAREGNGPTFVEVKTYRYKGHSVSDPAKYRTKDEVKSYRDRDPIKIIEDKVLSEKIASEEEIEAIKVKIKEEIAGAAKFADESNFPDPAELYNYVYVEENYPYIMD
jgi:pyruvate dehydrogenase E1 component alpha subunit